MQKTRINLDLLLPDIPSERDECVRRLIQLLEGRSGIQKVHVASADGSGPQLCFHYDPSYTSIDKVIELARSAGADITRQYGHLLLRVEGIRQPRHARIIERKLGAVPGMLTVAVSGTGYIQVEFVQDRLDAGAIKSLAEKEGLRVVSVEDVHLHPESADTKKPAADHAHADDGHEHAHSKDGDDHSHEHQGHDHAAGAHDHSHGGPFGERTELIFSLICGALLGVGFGLSFIHGLSGTVPVCFYAAAYFFGGYYTTKEAIAAIRGGGFEIDFLMLVAAVGAAVLGQWAEGALLLFLFSLGHSLEHYAMEKARKSIAALSGLAPKAALLRQGNETKEVPIEQLNIGDVIVVKPNTRLPADGIVVAGGGSVDQAPITGESIPVEKKAVSDAGIDPARADSLEAQYRVFAGTINGNGSLDIKVSKRAADSTIARLVKMVNEAQTRKSPTQHFTDRFEKYFVPAVLVLVVLLCFAFLVLDEPFSKSFYRAMAVLVAASPCALAIATPSAVLSGVARAARAGVLIKGGKPLEDLGSLSAMAFDKTGTLTEGRPRLTKLAPMNGLDENELLKIAVAVEALSDHPIARAIVRDGKERLKDASLPQASGLEALPGKGIKASLDGAVIYMGNLALFESLDDKKPPADLSAQVHGLESEGNTAMVIRRDGDYIGIVAVMDTPREEAKAALDGLRALGIRRMIMLTGDNQQVADAVAAQTGITDAWGGLLPEQKVEAVRKLRTEEKTVAMVGDGVNDAPAMANSTVGIAMGAAGSDVALETADIALMGDKLALLPFAIGLSRKARGIIRQNLVISLGMVALLIPLTILGIASIGPAVVAHEGSTLLVVFNALRLLAYKK